MKRSGSYLPHRGQTTKSQGMQQEVQHRIRVCACLQEVGDQRCAQDGAANDAQVHLIRQRQRVVRGGYPGVRLAGSLGHLAI